MGEHVAQIIDNDPVPTFVIDARATADALEQGPGYYRRRQPT